MKIKALATVTYDVFNREAGYIEVTNKGFLDRTKIFQELLKLDMWRLYLTLDSSERLYISCDTIKSITLHIDEHTIPIDCTEYYRMYYDKKQGKPVPIDNRLQAMSTLTREKSKSGARKIGKLPYKRQ